MYIPAKPLQEKQKEIWHLRKFRGVAGYQAPACDSVTITGLKSKVISRKFEAILAFSHRSHVF